MAGMRMMVLVLVVLFIVWQANYGDPIVDVKVGAVSTERVMVDGGGIVVDPTIVSGRKTAMTINNGASVESERQGEMARSSMIAGRQVVGKSGSQSGKEVGNVGGRAGVEETSVAAFAVFNSDYHPATHHPPSHN